MFLFPFDHNKQKRITELNSIAPRHCEKEVKRKELLRNPQHSFWVNFLCGAMPHSGNAVCVDF